MKQSYSTMLFICLLLGGACKKMVDIPAFAGHIDGDKVFTNDFTAMEAVNGIYIGTMGEAGLLNGVTTRAAGLCVDEFDRSSFYDLDTGFQRMNLSPAYRPLIQLWRKPYELIQDCNVAIEGLRKNMGVSAALKEQLIGEAKFLRALNYFYLINLFGDVPLITTTDYRINAVAARTNIDEVYNQIIHDLEDAERLLPVVPVGSGNPVNKRTRAGKWAAAALLARVYLYRENWQQADLKASAVIGSGLYPFAKELSDVFVSENSQEIILQFQPVNSKTTTEANYFVGSIGGRPVYEPTSDLLNSFESGDQRKSAWLKKVPGFAGQDYYAITKYKATKDTTYQVVLRVTEQLLIRAEARIRLGNHAGALEDINHIRERAQLTGLPDTLSRDSMLVALMAERRHELFAEWGQRFFDLKRWHSHSLASDVLRQEAAADFSKKAGWQPFKKLFPVPDSEIKANVRLVQNPGY